MKQDRKIISILFLLGFCITIMQGQPTYQTTEKLEFSKSLKDKMS
jgi:hypothetical protein